MDTHQAAVLTESQLELITEFASLAPSVHNSQPWRFRSDGHTLEVHADPTRQLVFLDPSSRQLHLSCGAAAQFAYIAVRTLGYSCIVRLAPRSSDPRLLATLTLGGPAAVTPRERRWYDAAFRRYTDRGPYDDTPVPRDVLTRMADAAGEVGSWLRVLNRPGDRLLAATLLDKAEEIEADDPRYKEELDKWRRPAGADDGIPAGAAPAWPIHLVSDVSLRDFTGTGRHPRPGGHGDFPQVERDTLILVGSAGDEPLSWLRTGRALAAVLLTATDAGLVSQPLGQVTDVPTTRSHLQRGLGLLGHPQLMLRMGYGHGQPVTRRRPVEDTLVVGAVT